MNSRLTPALAENAPKLQSLIAPGKSGAYSYTWSVIIFGTLAGSLLITWFALLPYRRTPEEELQQAIARGEMPAAEDKDISADLASLLE